MNCYVLAGGRSRRMGRSKSELFLDRVIEAAREAFDEVIIVDRAECGGHAAAASREGGHAARPVARHGRATPERRHGRRTPTIFESLHDGEGPVFGIRAALQHANRGRCFILAVDYPLITPEVLTYLRDRGGIPIWRDKPQPLCAVYDVAMLPLIESRIAAGQFDVRGLVEDVDVIEESELRARFAGEPLLNVNTPEDLEEFHERVLASR